MEMLREHVTSSKIITHPIFYKEKGLQKRYRGVEYKTSKTRNKVSYRLGSYRGVEYLMSRYN